MRWQTSCDSPKGGPSPDIEGTSGPFAPAGEKATWDNMSVGTWHEKSNPPEVTRFDQDPPSGEVSSE